MTSPTKKKKKKKERERGSPPANQQGHSMPAPAGRKPLRRPSRLEFVTRTLDFGVNKEGAASAPPGYTQLTTGNRYEILNVDSDSVSTFTINSSCPSSVITVNNSPEINPSPLNNSPNSNCANKSLDRTSSTYGTPGVSAPNTVKTFPLPYPSKISEYVPATTFISTTLSTTTTLTYTLGTMVHSTPNVSPRTLANIDLINTGLRTLPSSGVPPLPPFSPPPYLLPLHHPL